MNPKVFYDKKNQCVKPEALYIAMREIVPFAHSITDMSTVREPENPRTTKELMVDATKERERYIADILITRHYAGSGKQVFRRGEVLPGMPAKTETLDDALVNARAALETFYSRLGVEDPKAKLQLTITQIETWAKKNIEPMRQK